jgi:ATP-dependent Clp protease ATP-binding subunit ClpA
MQEVTAIARKELSELGLREGFSGANIQITWSEDLVRTLAREGYDHRLGTRPLQRVIEKRVAVPLARWRVGHPKATGITLHVDLNNQGQVTVNG